MKRDLRYFQPSEQPLVSGAVSFRIPPETRPAL